MKQQPICKSFIKICALSFIITQSLMADTNLQDSKNITPPPPIDNLALNTKLLETIITSSTGFDLPIKDEAKNVLIINKEDLQNKGYMNLLQALQYSPFLRFSDSGFGQNIDLRGQGLDSARAVKILVNRVPISLLDTSHGVAPYNNIDVEDIESIEIIPGGGAVVYGNGTRGGVVNIVTKTPSKDFYRSVLKFSSGEKLGLQGANLMFSAGKKISDKLFLRGDINVGYIPGVRNTMGIASDKSVINAFSNDNTSNLYVGFQARYDITADSTLDFNTSYSHVWTNSPLDYLSLVNSSRTGSTPKTQDEIKGERNNPSDYTIKSQTDSLQTSLNYTQKISESLNFDALAFYQFSKLTYTDYKYCASTKATEAYNCPGGILNMGNDSGFQNHGGGLNLKVKHETQKNILIVGLDNILEYSNRLNYIDHYFPFYDSSSSQPQPPQESVIVHYNSNVSNKATKLSNSVYVFNDYKVNKQFDISGGARLEYSNYWTSNDQYYWQRSKKNTDSSPSYIETTEQTFFNYHTQRLGYALELTPNYKYSDTGNVYAKAELGFISPSAYQMINADPNSSINAGSSGNTLVKNEANGIKPEQYLTLETGWKDEYDWSYISATLFYTHTFNEIYVNNISHGTAYTYSNLGQTQRIGLEFLAKQSFGDTDWLRLSESISPLYTNVLQVNGINNALKGGLIPYVPWLKATFNVEVDVIKTDLVLLSFFLNNAYYSQNLALNGSATATTYTTRIMNKNGYLLTDLGLNFGYKSYKLNLGIRNLFDSWYATYQKGDSYYPGFGRSYYAELRYSF